MKRGYKFLSAAILASSIMTASGAVMAAEEPFGAESALVDEEYSLEEMLVYAIQDEYLAQAEYDVIMSEFGVDRPFSNIAKAEAKHIELLLPLFEAHGIPVPDNNASEKTVVPSTLSEIYKTGVEAEIKNIDMYEKFLKEDLPEDVRTAFESLKAASENHLRAFEKASEGQNGAGKGNRKSTNKVQGRRNRA